MPGPCQGSEVTGRQAEAPGSNIGLGLVEETPGPSAIAGLVAELQPCGLVAEAQAPRLESRPPKPGNPTGAVPAAAAGAWSILCLASSSPVWSGGAYGCPAGPLYGSVPMRASIIC